MDVFYEQINDDDVNSEFRQKVKSKVRSKYLQYDMRLMRIFNLCSKIDK